MKYRPGFMPKAPQGRLTPKSAFLRRLEKAQARATAKAASAVITVEFEAADLVPLELQVTRLLKGFMRMVGERGPVRPLAKYVTEV